MPLTTIASVEKKSSNKYSDANIYYPTYKKPKELITFPRLNTCTAKYTQENQKQRRKNPISEHHAK